MKKQPKPFYRGKIIRYILAIMLISHYAMAKKTFAKNNFYGNVNAEIALNGNANLPVRLGGGSSFDMGYLFGHHRIFINSGIHYLSGKAANYDFNRKTIRAFSFVHIPLTINYGISLNVANVSFIPSLGFGYSFTTSHAYDIETDGRAVPFQTPSFVVAPKLSIVYNLKDNGFIGGLAGGYVFASQHLKLTYMVIGFTGGAKF
ncbi:MAG: hypothetical protein ACR2NY_05785 [Alphaproteobacteria bacterium]